MLTITSPAFAHNETIPRRFTCEGEGVSPPLQWGGVPSDARALVLIVDDPDAPDPAAPKRTWVHWVVYNLPPDSIGLPENVGNAGLPPGTLVGRNDSHEDEYGSVCPPIGSHRYFFKLYALSSALPNKGSLTKAEVEQAMAGHILAQAELIGTYQKT